MHATAAFDSTDSHSTPSPHADTNGKADDPTAGSDADNGDPQGIHNKTESQHAAGNVLPTEHSEKLHSTQVVVIGLPVRCSKSSRFIASLVTPVATPAKSPIARMLCPAAVRYPSNGYHLDFC